MFAKEALSTDNPQTGTEYVIRTVYGGIRPCTVTSKRGLTKKMRLVRAVHYRRLGGKDMDKLDIASVLVPP